MAKQVGTTMTINRRPRAKAKPKGLFVSEGMRNAGAFEAAEKLLRAKASDPGSVVRERETARKKKPAPRKKEELFVYKSKAGTRYTNKRGAKKGERRQ